MTPVLSVKNAAKNFHQPDGTEFRVLDNLSFTLNPGEIVCLLGASGSGKTTLLRLLAGFDTEYKGEILSDIKRPGSALGYLSQNDRLLPWRTAAENASLGLELLGRNKKAALAVARGVLAQVGLGAFADYAPSQLSGGMQQRVLLARMLCLKPKLLLLDEPVSALDILARRELSALIKNYVRENQAAALVVTHSVEEACFLADRVLLVTRAPAQISKEIRLTDDATAGGALHRGDALDAVMQGLLKALGAAS